MIRSHQPGAGAAFVILLMGVLGLATTVHSQSFRLLVDNSDMLGNVEVTASIIENIVTVRLDNHDDYDVRCKVRFDTGADRRTRQATVSAGEQAVVTFRVARPNSTQKVRVHATCDAAEEES